MQLVETTLTPTTIRVRLADKSVREEATSWIECEFPVRNLKLGSETPVGDPNIRRLALVHQAALRTARSAIAAEIQRLEHLAEQNLP